MHPYFASIATTQVILISPIFSFNCLCLSLSQGARVWVRDKDQLLPSTVSCCDEQTLILTTDYGEVK